MCSKLDESDYRIIERMKESPEWMVNPNTQHVFTPEGGAAFFVLALDKLGFVVSFEERDMFFELLYDLCLEEIEWLNKKK